MCCAWTMPTNTLSRWSSRMKELGLFGATIPSEHGGLGLSATSYVRIIEKIASVWMSLTGIINST